MASWQSRALSSQYWNAFFLAVPEAALEDELIKYLTDKKLIDPDGVARINAIRKSLRRAGNVRGKLRGKSLLERLMIVGPEIINRQMVDALEGVGMMRKQDAGVLRLALRFGAVGKGGLAPPAVILQRIRKVFGVGFANDALNLAVDLGYMARKDADKAKAVLLVGNSARETLAALQNAKNMQNVMLLIANGTINNDTIKALQLAGLLDSRTAKAFLEAIDYGGSLWTVFEGAKRAEGYAARLAYVVSGAFSHEAVDVVKAVRGMSKSELEKLGLGWLHGRIKPEHMFLLEVATNVSQQFNRQMMEQMTERRYRVTPGERPITSFARASKQTEGEILQLLSKAADDAAKRSRALAGTARGADYAIKAAGLHQTMRQLWEGNGILTIFGEHQVADAAFESAQMLEKHYYDKLPQDIQQMLQYQAKAGLDSYVSRKENTQALSRLVYGNMNLWTGKVDQQVNIGLLQGQSAEEIGKRVSNLINPNVMGGVKYASMRIGRTELANAFHNTTIRYSREMPWVKGYLWNLSSSHGHGDTCDQYAHDDHDGIGEGVFKKANVPQKPHPQCLCYLTVVGVDDATFIKNYNRGFYNQYINSRISQPEPQSTFFNAVTDTAGKVAGAAAGQVALTAGSVMVDRMIRVGGPKIKAFNYKEFVGLKGQALKNKVKGFQKAAVEGEAAALAPSLPAVDTPKQVLKVEKVLSKEEALLKKRQKDFEDLFHVYEEGDHDEGEIERRYRKLLEGENGAILPNSTGTKLEDFSKEVYGQSSYRTLNAKLRMTHGDLDAYDDLFHENDAFWANFNSHYNDIEHTGFASQLSGFGEDARDIAAQEAKMPLLVDAKKRGFFGISKSDLETYYEEVAVSAITRANHAKDAAKELLKINAHSDIVRSLDNSMLPTVDDNFLWRIADKDWTGLGHEPTVADIGATFVDNAYTSTEAKPEYFFNKGVNSLDQKHRATRFMIHAPAGTMATRFNLFENEIGLARGTKFQILDVRDVEDISGFEKEIHLAIIDQKDTWSDARDFFSKNDEDDMWDTIMGDF